MNELHTVIMSTNEIQLMVLLVERHLDNLDRSLGPHFDSIRKKMDQFEVILEIFEGVQERVIAATKG